MKRNRAAIAVTRHRGTGEFLLLRRSSEEDVLGSKWEFPSGGIEEQDEKPSEGALRELQEETGLEGEVIRSGGVGEAEFDDYIQEFHIFLVDVSSEDVELSEEHSDYKWCEKEEIKKLETVEGVELNMEALDLYEQG